MVLVYFHGLTGEVMKANGKKVNSMEEVNMQILMALEGLEYGKMVQELNGLILLIDYFDILDFFMFIFKKKIIYIIIL